MDPAVTNLNVRTAPQSIPSLGESCFLSVLSLSLTGAVPSAAGPSVFPSGEPGVSGDFWGSQEGCQHKEIEQLAQDHMTTQCWHWDSGPNGLLQEHAPYYWAILQCYVNTLSQRHFQR